MIELRRTNLANIYSGGYGALYSILESDDFHMTNESISEWEVIYIAGLRRIS